MQYWNIYLTIKGPAKTIEVPNKGNPVKASTLQDVLRGIIEQIKDNGMIEFIGIRIENRDYVEQKETQ